MRKYRHLPQFHKRPSKGRDETSHPRRRRHDIYSKFEGPIEVKESRKHLYLHGALRKLRRGENHNA